MNEHPIEDLRVAIVTGAGSGVGAATALLLAQRRFHVLVNFSRSAEGAAEVAERCRAQGVDALPVQGDVASDADCRRLAAVAVERWGRIDALVNCAGTTAFVPMADMDGVDASDFQRIYAVNAIGPFQMARAVAQQLRMNRGAIVNVSSTASITGMGSSWPYVASKGALNALTLGLARMLAPEVRVNAVLPGMIEGRWFREGLGDEAYEGVRRQFASIAALGTVATPEQIAETVVWLLVGSTVTTGQLMVVDAGATLGRAPEIKGRRSTGQ